LSGGKGGPLLLDTPCLHGFQADCSRHRFVHVVQDAPQDLVFGKRHPFVGGADHRVHVLPSLLVESLVEQPLHIVIGKNQVRQVHDRLIEPQVGAENGADLDPVQ
jgi:hypothetical protein